MEFLLDIIKIVFYQNNFYLEYKLFFVFLYFSILLFSFKKSFLSNINPIDKNKFLYVEFFIPLTIGIFWSYPFLSNGDVLYYGNSDDYLSYLFRHLAIKNGPFGVNWERVMAGGVDYKTIPDTKFFSLLWPYSKILPLNYIQFIVPVFNCIISYYGFKKVILEFTKKVNIPVVFFSSIGCIVYGMYQGHIPDSSQAYMHGVAIIPWISWIFLTKFHDKHFYYIVLATSTVAALASIAAVHLIIPYFTAIIIWYPLYYHKKPLRFLLGGIIFFGAYFLWQADYFLAIFQMMGQSARVGVLPQDLLKVKSYYLSKSHLNEQILVLISFLVIGLTGKKTKLKLNSLRIFLLYIYGVYFSNLMIRWAVELIKIPYRFELIYLGTSIYVIISIALLMSLYWEQNLAIRNKFFKALPQTVIIFSILFFGKITIREFTVILLERLGKSTQYTLDPHQSVISKNEYPGLYRIANLTHSSALQFWGGLKNFELSNGYINLISNQRTLFWKNIVSKTNGNLHNLNNRDNSIKRIHLLGLINNKYLLSHEKLNYEGIKLEKLITQNNGKDKCELISDKRILKKYFCLLRNERTFLKDIYLYKVEKVFPRVYFADQVKEKYTPHLQMIEEAFDDNIAFIDESKKEIENVKDLLNEKNQDKENRFITGIDINKDELFFNVKIKSPQFVIINEISNKYWKLFVNDRPKKYFNVNLTQVGFPLENGEYQISYVYCPPYRLVKNKKCNIESTFKADKV